ncbi:hypothetical protein HYT23_03610 [Candidatus Pacearchaeota archaeon]|nr:hypothetical protein [Candidatus Pacearchaeota archaeon]
MDKDTKDWYGKVVAPSLVATLMMLNAIEFLETREYKCYASHHTKQEVREIIKSKYVLEEVGYFFLTPGRELGLKLLDYSSN